MSKRIEKQAPQKKPLQFALVGAPFKCPNLEKCVLGKEPDLGEPETPLCLEHITEGIQKISPPGACIHILLMGMPVTRYKHSFFKNNSV